MHSWGLLIVLWVHRVFFLSRDPKFSMGGLSEWIIYVFKECEFRSESHNRALNSCQQHTAGLHYTHSGQSAPGCAWISKTKKSYWYGKRKNKYKNNNNKIVYFTHKAVNSLDFFLCNWFLYTIPFASNRRLSSCNSS